MENIKISKCNTRIEGVLGQVGVSANNLGARTRVLARLMNVTSISLDGKDYNPQKIIQDRIPKDKLTKAHNQLYKRFGESL